jgi:hypothetical protein
MSDSALPAAPIAPPTGPVGDPAEVAPDEALPDVGEPQSSRDGRPQMLSKRFRRVVMLGSAVGVVLAIGMHYLITQTVEDSTRYNGWSWAFAVIGGFAVGGACSLFIYGAATDRSDTENLTVPGRADVSVQGEWRRTVNRRRRRARGVDAANRSDQSDGVDPSDDVAVPS